MSAAPTTQQHVAPTYHAGGGASPEEKAASAESHHGFQRQHRAPGQVRARRQGGAVALLASVCAMC